MHLLLKCISEYSINEEPIIYMNGNINDIVICDSFIKFKGESVGFGYNYKSKTYGLFPFDKYVIIYTTRLIGSDLFINAKNKANVDFSSTISRGAHHRPRLNGLKEPIICLGCGDYMMGVRLEFQTCIVCNHTFHEVCFKNRLFPHCTNAIKVENLSNNSAIILTEQELSEWTTKTLMLWLLSMNFFRIIDVIDHSKITAKTLKDSFGSDNIMKPFPLFTNQNQSFYQTSLYNATRYLLQKPENPLQNQAIAQEDSIKLENIQLSDKSYLYFRNEHILRQVTYHEIVSCNYCNVSLFGLHKQGFHCIRCRKNYHKICCSLNYTKVCQNSLETKPDIYDSINFGIPLSEQVLINGIPVFLKFCITELEKCFDDIYKIEKNYSLIDQYLKTTSPEESLELLTQFSHASFDPNGHIEYIELPSCKILTALLKLYLKELPEPILPFALYQSLIDCLNKSNPDLEKIRNVLVHLPEPNKSVLQALTNHFFNIIKVKLDSSTGNLNSLADIWSKIFSKTLIWPPHIMMNKGLEYKSKQKILIQCIFEYKLAFHNSNSEQNNQINEQSLQIQNVEEVIDDASYDITKEDWYFDNISKSEVDELFDGLGDGYFLIRNSADSASGKFTLTIRKNGMNKLIRIIEHDGYCGFKIPCEFKSVTELVNYYNTHSLSEVAEEIDEYLKYPLSKLKFKESQMNKLTNEELIEEWYKSVQSNYKIDMNSEKKEKLENKRDELVIYMKGIDEVRKLCKCHLESLDVNSTKRHVQLSFNILNRKIAEYEDIEQKKQDEINSLNDQIDATNRLLSIERRYLNSHQKVISQLKIRGIPDEFFYISRESVNFDRLKEELYETFTKLVMEDQNDWYYESLSREESTKILLNAPNGAFLIRKSQFAYYSLDIVVGNQIKHCKIHCANGKYGFFEEYLNFDSLQSIVNRYRIESMEKFNADLKIKLLYPAKTLK